MRIFNNEGQVIVFLHEVLRHKPGCFLQKIYLRFTSGFPDLVVGFDGMTVFYEVKPFRNDLSYSLKQFEPIQVATIKKMRAAGMDAHGLIVESEETAWLVGPGTMGLDAQPLTDFRTRWHRHPCRLEP